ncbi:MAG: proteasome assembly chaperone family protein [Thermoplasmata archaeon]
MDGVHIHLLKELDLRGSVLIDGFPSVGLVSSIVANYLVELLGLEQVGVVDSAHFPTVALVKGGVPLHPVRIYAGGQEDGGRNIVIFISEFQPAATMIKDIADALLNWAEAKECSLLVCPEGLIVDREAGGTETVSVYGVGSTSTTNAMLQESDVPIFEEGVITGVAGVLLNEGRKRGFDVISVLSEAHPDFPDARAAARVIETMDRVLLKMGLDTKPLYEEAGRIEEQLKSINRRALEVKRPDESRSTSMYG